MLIRELEPKDVSKLSKLIISYKGEANREISESQEEKIRELLTLLIDKEDSITLVAENDNEIAGYINGHTILFPILISKECYVSGLLVKSSLRGRSIGENLIKELEIRAKKMGCFRLMLNNPKEALSYEKGFYSKKGFTERKNFANFVKNL